MTESEILARYQAEAVPVCGWPEWNGNAAGYGYPKRIMPQRLFLFVDEDEFPGESWWHIETGDGEGWAFRYGPSDHEALCLWWRHARKWLLKQGIQVIRHAEQTWRIASIGQDAFGRGDWCISDLGPEGWGTCPILDFPDEDSALLAALAAVGKEKE